MTKRVWIDRDPAYEGVRQREAEAVKEIMSRFTHRLAGHRKNSIGGRPRWDPFWPDSIATAAEQLGIDMIWINSGAFFRTADERDKTAAAAKVIWEQRKAAWKAKAAGQQC